MEKTELLNRFIANYLGPCLADTTKQEVLNPEEAELPRGADSIDVTSKAAMKKLSP